MNLELKQKFKNIIDKHAFVIYEFAEVENDSIIKDLLSDLNTMTNYDDKDYILHHKSGFTFFLDFGIKVKLIRNETDKRKNGNAQILITKRKI